MVFRYNGVDYPSLPEMEENVGKKSSWKKYEEDGIWIEEYRDHSEEHLNYMAKLELEMQLSEKKARYNYINTELLYDKDNQTLLDEGIQLRTDITELETMIGGD